MHEHQRRQVSIGTISLKNATIKSSEHQNIVLTAISPKATTPRCGPGIQVNMSFFSSKPLQISVDFEMVIFEGLFSLYLK
jgi:hypothetical protein